MYVSRYQAIAENLHATDRSFAEAAAERAGIDVGKWKEKNKFYHTDVLERAFAYSMPDLWATYQTLSFDESVAGCQSKFTDDLVTLKEKATSRGYLVYNVADTPGVVLAYGAVPNASYRRENPDTDADLFGGAFHHIMK